MIDGLATTFYALIWKVMFSGPILSKDIDFYTITKVENFATLGSMLVTIKDVYLILIL